MPCAARRPHVAEVVARVGRLAVVYQHSIQPVPHRRRLGHRHERPQVKALGESDVSRHFAAVSSVTIKKYTPIVLAMTKTANSRDYNTR